MPTPTLVKTWTHSTNNSIAAQASILLVNQSLLLAFKNALITSGFTVVSSSNSVSVSLVGVDHWSTASNLVFNTATHSWIVLKAPTAFYTNYQICIDLNAVSANGILIGAVAISPSAGFVTGGTTSARPTATDEYAAYTSLTWNAGTTNVASVWNLQYSTDGKAFRFFVFQGGTAVMLFSFQAPASPTSGWTIPAVLTWVTSPTYAVLFTNSTPIARARVNAISANLTWTGEATTVATQMGGQLLTAPNDISGEWPLFPIGILSTTLSARGRHGYLEDIWCASTTRATGDTYPASGTKLFIGVGNLVLPWNPGVVPVLF